MSNKIQKHLESIESEFNNLEDEKDKLEKKVSELYDELETVKEYDNEVEYGNGLKEALHWKCDNIAVQTMMEVLEEKLAKHGPLKIERLLETIS
jgi:predicted nuclease with TOPRIM domain